jgi:hypothetical protein
VSYQSWFLMHIAFTFTSWGWLCMQSVGIEVSHSLAGHTYLCQPTDTVIKKMIKCSMQENWEDWMLEGGGLLMELWRSLHENWSWKGSLLSIPIFQMILREMLVRRKAVNGFKQCFN